MFKHQSYTNIISNVYTSYSENGMKISDTTIASHRKVNWIIADVLSHQNGLKVKLQAKIKFPGLPGVCQVWSLDIMSQMTWALADHFGDPKSDPTCWKAYMSLTFPSQQHRGCRIPAHPTLHLFLKSIGRYMKSNLKLKTPGFTGV